MTTTFKQFCRRLLRGYSVPVVVSLLVHAVVFGLMIVNWSSPSEPKVLPAHIKASVVPMAQPKPAVREVEDKAAIARAQQAEQEKIKRQAQQKQARQEAERQKHIALKKKQAADAKAKKAEEEAKRREKERQKALAQERERAAQKKKAQEALKRRLAQEQAAREQVALAEAEQAAKDSLEVSRYGQLIKGLISQYWNRPPSARNGMETVIQLRLSPFGELQGYKIIKGSGNEAFDRSVVQAVQLSAPFTELKSLDRRIFDNNFRRFTIRFSPEDLMR